MNKLLQKLQQILSEKINKILPQNIKAGNTIFGVTGSLKDYTEILIDTYNWMYIPKLVMNSDGSYKYEMREAKTFPLINSSSTMTRGAGYIIQFEDDGIYMYVGNRVSTTGLVENGILRLYYEKYNNGNDFKKYVLKKNGINVTDLILDPEYINEWEEFEQYKWVSVASNVSVDLNTSNDIYGILTFIDTNGDVVIKGQATQSQILRGFFTNNLLGGFMTGTLEKSNTTTFATIEEMNNNIDFPEDTYAIVHGVNYIGTYRMDSGKWTEVGNKSEGQQIFDQLNLISDTDEQYEGSGGTDQEIISVLNQIKPEEVLS